MYIDDFLDENNAVLSLPDVNEKFDIRVPFTTYYSIVRTVRANIDQLNLVKIQRPTIPKYLNIILNDKKVVRTYIMYLYQDKLISRNMN